MRNLRVPRFLRFFRLVAALIAVTSTLVCILSQAAPAASSGSTPASVSAVVSGANEITVRWAQPPGAVTSGYEVQMVEGGNKVAVMTAASTSFPFSGLTAGRWYSFRVRAVLGVKKGPYSATTSALYILKPGETSAPVTVPNELSAPTSLSLTVNDRSVAISWTPPRLGSSQKIANYVVTAIPGPIVLTVSASTSTAGFGELRSGTVYNFTVQAVFTDGRRSPVISSAPVAIGPTTTTTTTGPPATAATLPPTTTTTTLPPTTTTTTTLPPLPFVPALAAIPVSKCISAVWPTSTLGRPTSFGAGAKRGAFVWFENGVWNVHLYNPSSSPSLFTGSIATGSTQKIYPTYTEGATDIVKAGSKLSTFSFSTANDIDAVRVASPCSRSATFSFLVNGQAMSTDDIYVGASGAHPLSSRFVITR
jgi:Fibronectin type III domain